MVETEAKRLAQEEKEESARQRQLARESDWISASPKARQAKSKARVSAYEELLKQSREKTADVAQITIPPGPELGNIVIDADHLRKSFGDRLLIDDLSFKLPRGGIVGVIGPNGAGKTTLFRMITGVENPIQGQSKSAIRCVLVISIKRAILWMIRKPFTKKFPAAMKKSI